MAKQATVFLETWCISEQQKSLRWWFAQREDYSIILRSTSSDTLSMLSYHKSPTMGNAHHCKSYLPSVRIRHFVVALDPLKKFSLLQ